MKKILVGCPTSDNKSYCLKEYVEGIKKLPYKNHDILFVDNSKSQAYSKKIRSMGFKVIKDYYKENARDRITSSRNIIREEAIKNYDYLLSLEQDVIPPADIIGRMLKHGKEITTGLYFTYKTEGSTRKIIPLLWILDGKQLRNLTEEEAFQDKTIEVEAAGLGCMLISREVLEKIKFRYEKESEAFDDMWFCKDAKEKGYKITADTSIRCKHLIKRWSWEKIKK